MKLFFTIIVLIISTASHADECPDSVTEKIKTYVQDPEFVSSFTSQVEVLTGIKLTKVEFLESRYPGDSHAGLNYAFVPSGLARIGEGHDVMNDQAYDTEREPVSLILESSKGKVEGSFRFDDWTLCQGGKIVQPWVNIGGSVGQHGWIDYIWDYENKVAIGPSSTKSLVSCFAKRGDGPRPFAYGFGMGIYQTAEKGRYYVSMGFGEPGSFALTDCKLTSNTSLSCEGDTVHHATISWMGLVEGRPDAIDLEITGRNASGVQETLAAKTHYECK